MRTLAAFNQLKIQQAKELLASFVAISHWADALAANRPYITVSALYNQAENLTLSWGEAELDEALAEHPRIGERRQKDTGDDNFSRKEQGQVDNGDNLLQQRLLQANLAYELRFGRIFLIRAAGRSGETILSEIARRMQLTPDEEIIEALEQLRQITLLRLRESIN